MARLKDPKSPLGNERAAELRAHLNKVFNVEAFPEMIVLVNKGMKDLEQAQLDLNERKHRHSRAGQPTDHMTLQ